MSRLDLERLWSQGEGHFVRTLGFLFEQSPWVVERTWRLGPFADAQALLAASARVLARASPDERLALIRAHPELATRAALAEPLTAASQSEQKSAGLDRLTPDEFARFHALNTAYRERFAFPFIICVRLNDKTSILAAMEARLESDVDAEIDTALGEILAIARLRLTDALAP
jgi:2-oxo-4-hydroxy-4-carboxy-5-ureidoimidazoline decarboxylase